ncbi:hypothetical protein [Actinophytocola sp.]|jgi:hypothetical protein|uniref:hypothetical protein n=1 Tax=Actinophytocola sp. TaxID=1872138 RepID=UPI002ED9A381
MNALLLLFVPLVALVVWGVVFDLKRRRRPVTGHDISSAAKRARGNAEAGGAGSPEPGGGMNAGSG